MFSREGHPQPIVTKSTAFPSYLNYCENKTIPSFCVLLSPNFFDWFFTGFFLYLMCGIWCSISNSKTNKYYVPNPRIYCLDTYHFILHTYIIYYRYIVYHISYITYGKYYCLGCLFYFMKHIEVY